ncbi:MAG: arylesterase [Gemmatimonadota bacterium]
MPFDYLSRVPLFLALAVVLACDRTPRSSAAGGQRAGEALPAEATSSHAVPAPAAEAPLIVFLGTSLTAGLGVAPEQAYPALIQQKIDSAGLSYRVMNAGVSGETSAGALRRLDWLLSRPVAVLVVETGANDGLRGQDPDATRANLETILTRARERNPDIRLVVVGMEALPNLGADYVRRFRAIYPAVARKHRAALVPFLLAGVAGVDSLNQSDGIHPTPRGHQIMANTVWKTLQPLLAGGT